ncbi:hypothetical protein D3C86_1532780 [compost metagenome]
MLKAVFELASDTNAEVFKVLLSIGNPSTIISGWLLPLIELTPRMVIDDEAPGTPEELVTSTPATLPCKALIKFSRCVSAMAAPLTVCCEVPSSRFLTVLPKAVITTSSKPFESDFNATLMVVFAPTVLSIVV